MTFQWYRRRMKEFKGKESTGGERGGGERKDGGCRACGSRDSLDCQNVVFPENNEAGVLFRCSSTQRATHWVENRKACLSGSQQDDGGGTGSCKRPFVKWRWSNQPAITPQSGDSEKETDKIMFLSCKEVGNKQGGQGLGTRVPFTFSFP